MLWYYKLMNKLFNFQYVIISHGFSDHIRHVSNLNERKFVRVYDRVYELFADGRARSTDDTKKYIPLTFNLEN